MASLKIFLIFMVMVALMAPALGAKTVTVGIRNQKVTFSGFGGDRKYTVKTKDDNTYANVAICTGDSIKFKWDETAALEKYEEMGQFSNPKTAAALADCPQLWNSSVSEDLLEYKGTFTYKEAFPLTKYYATSHRYRGGRWSCDDLLQFQSALLRQNCSLRSKPRIDIQFDMSTDTSGAASKGKGKKKGAKFAPLPSIQAVEASLPWHVEYSSRAGRHAVANADLPAGTLVLVEQPFLRLPLSKFAAAVCTRCLRTLQKNGEVPPPGNPCLPRYCPTCKEQPSPLDTQLAALRIKLADIADTNKLDPLMLNILTDLELQRSGIEIAVPPAADMPAKSLSPDKQSFNDLRCTVADYDSMPNMWDRKPESWRKKFGPAMRALHKELTALSEAGTVPNYKVSPITRIQADAAQLPASLHQVTGPNAATETGIALFPGLNVFQHSCLPNAHFIVSASRIFVRTLLPVTKGTQLTVAYVQVTEPRSVRQQTLENERHFTCTCSRCAGPLKESVDRFLEGVICGMCNQDVMLPTEGADNDAARELWKERMIEMKAEDERNQAARAKKAAAKNKGGAVKKASKNSDGGAEKASEEKPAAEAEAENAEDGQQNEEEEQQQDISDDLPENIPFWQCCSCQAVLPAHTVDGHGPGDVITQAASCLHRGMTFIGLKDHAELAAKGEAFLEQVATGFEGRLAVYHNYVTSAQAPLINVNMRKGESIKVMNYAVQLWQADRELCEYRPSIQQMQCLEAIIEAAESKASAANSAVIKKQLEKKVKQAKDELKPIRSSLLGEL